MSGAYERGKAMANSRRLLFDPNAYDPSLAVLQNGVVCVAWHSFIDDNYDVYLSRRAAAGG